MLDTNTFARAMQCDPDTALLWAPHAEAATMEFGIASKMRVAMFVGQIGHESDGLTRLTESLNYRTQALIDNFGRHRISEADARRFGRNDEHPADQEMLANILYGGEWGRKNLGNTQPGDGWLFRGQGPKQITGRANTRAARDRLRARLGPRVPDFEAEPSLMCSPEWGMYVAADFWDSHGLNAFADRGDIEGCTRVINGALNGIEDRKQRYAHALKVLS